MFEHSVSMPDAVKGSQAAGPTRARAHSLPGGKDGDAEDGRRRYVMLIPATGL